MSDRAKPIRLCGRPSRYPRWTGPDPQLPFLSVGFNNGVRRALDPEMPLRRRFGALRYAVERFSPNGFNGTFVNPLNYL